MKPTTLTGVDKMKAFTGRQSTQVLCESLVMLRSLPNTPEHRLARAVMLDVLCERHPEAEAAAETWAASESYDVSDHDAAVISAALTAIGA